MHVAFIGRNADYDPDVGLQFCPECKAPDEGYAVMDDCDVVCSGFCSPEHASRWGEMDGGAV